MNKINSNLEFRKIKSLQFLYEVNENGTIFRNIKSKKQLKIKLDNDGYYETWVSIKKIVKRVPIARVVAECWLGDKPLGYQIDHIDRNRTNNHYSNLRYVTHNEQMKNRVLSDKIINQAKLNCLKWTMNYVAKPVKIVFNDIKKEFPSQIQCANYLGEYYNLKSEHIRGKLKQKRKKIYDFDIFYLNAETRRTNSKE